MSLMPYDQALNTLIQSLVQTQATEKVALLQSKGRILAEPIVALSDAPSFDNSAMDGYAVCGVNMQTWQLVDYIAAGDSTKNLHLTAGQAVRIFTGSALPQGAEAVIPQEDVNASKHMIHATAPVFEKQHIRFQAEEFSQGQVLVEKDQVLSATHIGIAATQGITAVLCYVPLKVSVFSSGNELQPLGKELEENQIYDSNRVMLMALLNQQAYFKVEDAGLLPDRLEVIEEKLALAAEKSDVILISGGASVGDKDYTKQAIENIGQIKHWKLAIKPGKPFAWGNIAKSKVFVLPGNPVACWVTYLVLALPGLKVLAGIQEQQAMPKMLVAQAQFEQSRKQSRLQFLRGNVAINSGRLQVDIHSLQSSSMLANCGMSNALVIIPKEQIVTYGQDIQIIYLNSI